MSELREEILGTGINKKRIIGIALVAIILIAMFAFSTVFFGFLFGSQRPYPSREKRETEYEDALLIKPPSPFDADFWKDLFDQIDPDDLPALLDMLSEMLDGDIDELDLGNFSLGLLELLFAAAAGEIELFRVYDYLSFDDMEDVLWKYECFDEYTGEGWISNAGTDLYDFYSYGDYLSKYSPDPELLKIKMPLSPNTGINSMSIPTLFPTPFLIDGSFSAPNLNTGTEQLYKDEYNSTTIDLYFSSDSDVNITFNMFGLYNHLPTADELNNSAVDAIWTPSYITDKYIQLPPTIEVYRSNNGYFDYHLSVLEGIISVDDNAFIVANTIRNYLQTHFSFPQTKDDYNPAPEGRDVIDWFCETEQGIWSDFASAFCAFSRAFGVANRFVDGFNSFMIEEFFDDDEGQDGFAIKYKNLYNWAEIYIPTDISGDGKWVQFDIFDSFGGGGNPILGGDYNITVSTDQPSYVRPQTASITAAISSDTEPSVEGMTINFEDYTTGQTLGQSVTDINGIASIQVDFNSSYTVGPHLIEASYDFFNAGYNLTTILGDISIALTDVNPGEINISDAQPDITNIAGYVYDPLNGKRVEGPELNIRLFEKGTSNEVPNVFSPSAIKTITNGDFTDLLDLNYNDDGYYEVRADLDGTWWIDTPMGTYDYSALCLGFQVPYYYITNSSNRMELNITKELDVLFYIDGIPSNYPKIPPNSPLVSRTQTLNLTARAFSVIQGPYSNKEVFFYDYSRGNALIGSAVSNINGYASINYFVGDYCVAGPNLLYARLGSQENYSYFILNENPTINIISGPTPRVINRTGAGATQFNIAGEIYDSTNNSIPISYSEITLILLKGGSDYSSYLDPSDPYQTDSTGNFDLTFGVADNTPPGNYTLRLDFNGIIDLSSYPYSYPFNLPILATSTYFVNDLKIEAEASLQFWINGTTNDDYNNPRINRNEDLNLTAYIHLAGVPINDGELVEFYDITQDNLFIGSDTTISGYATAIYSTNFNTVAGPHLIYATWNNRYNYSYFVLNDSISINLEVWPQNREINKYGPPDDTFIIQGYLNDTLNFKPIKYGEISIHIFDGGEIVDGLVLVSGSYQSDQYGTIFAEFTTDNFVPTGNYTLEAWFNGTFIYSSPNNIYNEHDFYLPYINSSSIAKYQLRVYDPDDIEIHFWINGTATLPTYYDWEGDIPESFYRGGDINFTVYIRNSSDNPAISGEVRIYNIYNNSYLLDSYTYNGLETRSGLHSFLINTNLWYGGLHYIKVNWSSYVTSNTTYVVLNEPVTISTNIDKNIILRDADSFSVWGIVQESGVPLRGLRLNIVLLNSTSTDVTALYLIGSNWLTINNDGSFQFSNSISLLCPQGEYSLNITFTGGIDATGIYQTNYMVHSNSTIQINITAGTYIVGNYDTRVDKEEWYFNDDLYVYGFLNWDNGTAMAFMELNVTIRDGDGNILASKIGNTLLDGSFNITLKVGAWPPDTEIWVYFFPEDSFGFPEMYYVNMAEKQVFREI